MTVKPTLIHSNRSLLHLDFRELIAFRWVLLMLISRDIKLRYRQTLLGVLWVVLQPLLTSGLFTVIFGKWVNIQTDGVPYFLFAFCGLIPWLAFSQAVQRASTSVLSDVSLVTKTYFPRLFMPLAGTLGVIVDFCLALLLMGIFLIYYGVAIKLQILFIPVCCLLLFIFTSGINLLLSAVCVYYRDVKHMIPFLMQMGMYASPLAYSSSLIPEKWRLLYSCNPLVGIIEAFRWSFLGIGSFPVYSFSISLLWTFLVFLGGLMVFQKFERYFADVI